MTKIRSIKIGMRFDAVARDFGNSGKEAQNSTFGIFWRKFGNF